MLLKPTSFIFRLARQRALPFRPLKQINIGRVDQSVPRFIAPTLLEAARDGMAQRKDEIFT
jgi:hypothetical protein